MPQKKVFAPKEYPDGPSRFSLLGLASTMGLHMVSGPIVGGGLGYLIDRYAGSAPWGLGIGFALGVVSGFRNVWLDFKRLQRGDEEVSKRERAEQGNNTGDDAQ